MNQELSREGFSFSAIFDGITNFFKSSDISENDKEEIFNQLQEFYFSEKFEKKK